MISANSFWMRLAEVLSALDALGLALESFLVFSPLPCEDDDDVVAIASE